jgi:hypothetical protein
MLSGENNAALATSKKEKLATNVDPELARTQAWLV